MTWQDYEEQKVDRFKARTKMAAGKAKEYASDEDRLQNFKDAAQDFGVSPLLVAGIYWHKHVSAVKRYIKEKQAGNNPELSEPIGGRIEDCQEYLDIIAALNTEGEEPSLEVSSLQTTLNYLRGSVAKDGKGEL